MDFDGVKLGVMVQEIDAQTKIDKTWVFRIDGELQLTGYQVGNKKKLLRKLSKQNIDFAPVVPARILEKANEEFVAGRILYQRDGEAVKKSWLLPKLEHTETVAEARRRLGSVPD